MLYTIYIYIYIYIFIFIFMYRKGVPTTRWKTAPASMTQGASALKEECAARPQQRDYKKYNVLTYKSEMMWCTVKGPKGTERGHKNRSYRLIKGTCAT